MYVSISINVLSQCLLAIWLGALPFVTSNYNCTAGQWGSACASCGQCKDRTHCDQISGRCELGCQLGYRMPMCTTNCEQGYYGQNCALRCGHCAGGAVCDMITGVCPDGVCEQWYIGNNAQCETFINPVNIHIIPRVFYVNYNSARLEQDVKLVPLAISHYEFHVEYTDEHQSDTTFRHYHHLESKYDVKSEILRLTIRGLAPNTQYWFRISIHRKHKGITDAGSPSKPVKVWTSAFGDNQIINSNMHIVKAILALQVLCLLCFIAMAIWLLYQYYGKSNLLQYNEASNNSFHSSPSEGDTSRVAFKL